MTALGDAPAPAGLADEERQAYARDGFILVRGLVDSGRADRLGQRLADYATGARPVPEGVAVQKEPRVARGEVAASSAMESIRKIEWLVGHDDLFTELAFDRRLVAIVQSLLGPDLKLFRDAVLMKPAHTGSPKGMHQDAPYWPVEPMTEVSCWIPFDRTNAENGCMMVIPGSHRRGALPHVSVTDDYVVPPDHYRAEDRVDVPMEPGDGLVFSALILHETGANLSGGPRRAVALSYMAASSRYVGPVPMSEYVGRMGGRKGFIRISGSEVPGGV